MINGHFSVDLLPLFLFFILTYVSFLNFKFGGVSSVSAKIFFQWCWYYVSQVERHYFSLKWCHHLTFHARVYHISSLDLMYDRMSFQFVSFPLALLRVVSWWLLYFHVFIWTFLQYFIIIFYHSMCFCRLDWYFPCMHHYSTLVMITTMNTAIEYYLRD